jgi:hypothetical protein
LLQRQNCLEPVHAASKASGQRTVTVRDRTAAEQWAGSRC